MTDITEVFNHYLDQYDSIDIAEAEFKKNLHEDSQLRDEYREWCHNVGCTEKSGFIDYAEEYVENQNDVWNSLNDFDE
ncbi:hypothetical protein EEL49_11915 [Muribaculaceae bacterium Isolate-104 (HZI)]|jgi:hypothetical protein|nr:hypothetical protein EEL49_11915 [Muribaculaceae bacterium Isolate-104 (HZI)]